MHSLGKYVVFGQVKADDSESQEVLNKLDDSSRPIGSKDETPAISVWIGVSGVL